MTWPFYVAPHRVSDGFGNEWECQKFRQQSGCHMEVVRPGKVQCVLCDQQGSEPAPSDIDSEGR